MLTWFSSPSNSLGGGLHFNVGTSCGVLRVSARLVSCTLYARVYDCRVDGPSNNLRAHSCCGAGPSGIPFLHDFFVWRRRCLCLLPSLVFQVPRLTPHMNWATSGVLLMAPLPPTPLVSRPAWVSTIADCIGSRLRSMIAIPWPSLNVYPLGSVRRRRLGS